MKKMIAALTFVLFAGLTFYVSNGYALQGPGDYGPGEGGYAGNYCPWCGQYTGPHGGYGMGPWMHRGYGHGYGMGPWMMGPGYGRGYGYGYGMGPWMMGPGYGYGPWMMHHGYGPWMMGPGYGYGPWMHHGYGMGPWMMGPTGYGYGCGVR